MIDVLVPVLGRPQNAQPLADSFNTYAPEGAVLVFICSLSDQEQMEACVRTGESTTWLERDVGSGDYARKINHGYRTSRSMLLPTGNPWILNASDDITFTDGWFENALRNANDDICVIATNDMANAMVKRGRFGTHCLIRRSYIDERGGTFDEQPGVVMWEGYDHNYVDQELCAVAKTRGVYRFAKDSVILHRHPLWRTAEWDDTYRKGHARIRDDLKLFAERAERWTSKHRDIVRR